MKISFLLARLARTALVGGLASWTGLRAHTVGDSLHDETERRFAREFRPVQVALLTAERSARAEVRAEVGLPPMAAAFARFSPGVRVRADEQFLYVESKGLPAHNMMVGITAWQQQVPLPQPYAGGNAWRLPLHPQPAAAPVSIKNRFLRGAIALAANGIPIFNPQNNRGEVSQEIGELDQWGGHCGRADDYHYHVAPLHLQSVLGPALPVAYALDGYAIYGLNEPDGTAPTPLDAYRGHETAALGYHYHASLKYPYVNGGFHGVVVEREEQVDPQPRAQGVREALTQLRGARITGFTTVTPEKSFALRYTVNGKPGEVNYATVGNGEWRFQFVAADGTQREETYRAGDRRGGGGGGGKGKKKGGPAPPRNPDAPEPREDESGEDGCATTPGAEGRDTTHESFCLRSSAVAADGVLPVEFTGDGASVSPPLEWVNAPAGTRSYAVIMHHLDPEGKTKWYWTLYNIPPEIRSLPKNVQGIGESGTNSVNRRRGYAPPHSKGPGAKSYILTVYALSAPLQLTAPPGEVNRDVLLAAMKDITLAQAAMTVTYTRKGEERGGERNGERGGDRGKGKAKGARRT